MESVAPYVTLERFSRISVPLRDPHMHVSEAHIKSDIASLADLDTEGVGYSFVMSGREFPPVSSQRTAETLLLAPQPPTNDAVRRLVSYGSSAIPYLLSSLDNVTPTKIPNHIAGITLASRESNLLWNPFNDRENRVFAHYKIDRNWKQLNQENTYQIKIGDICYVALGQIVGRPYAAAKYVPSGIACIDSPTMNPRLCAALRKAWTDNSPNQMLINTLLTDYYTRGAKQGKMLGNFTIATSFQSEAALRLLFYYPKYTVPMIAKRLDSLAVGRVKNQDNQCIDVPGPLYDREVRNGVQTDVFIKAVSWCKEPHIRGAVDRILRRSDDQSIIEAARS